jgi:ribosome-associated protein
MLVVNERLTIPLTELDFTFARSSGPGGQNVNKVNSKATLRWAVSTSPSLPEDVRERFVLKYRHRMTKEGELVINSQRYRDQGRNVADCLAKLREMLEAAMVVPKKRKPTKPSRGAKRRRLQDKRQRSETKERRRSPRTEA